MLSKVFEIVDHGTFIVVLATRLDGKPAFELHDDPALSLVDYTRNVDDYDRVKRLLARQAWPPETGHIIVTTLTNLKTDYMPETWGSNTLSLAHRHIIENWDDLRTGELIDCRVLRGEQTEPGPSNV